MGKEIALFGDTEIEKKKLLPEDSYFLKKRCRYLENISI